jgi:hypothetical protein
MRSGLGLRFCYACLFAAAMLAACGEQAAVETDDSAEVADTAVPQARNMRLVGLHELQGRSAYQPVVHAYGDRQILFVGHHAGEAMNPMTGNMEKNGLSILDVTDPSNPQLLAHIPPTNSEASGTQHVQICDGSVLPNGDAGKVYAVRTDGLLGYDLWDVTDPAAPVFLSTVAETGTSSRPESSRGVRETHKIQWECESGIGYFNGTPAGWRVTRALQIFDLGDPNAPRHVRDFGLPDYPPNGDGPVPDYYVSGLHQAFAVGNRVYLGYGSGNDGTLQILDRDKLLEGNPNVADPYAPTTENLLYPQIARLDMPRYWGVHTAKPIYLMPVPDYADDGEHSVRDFLLISSEAEEFRCEGARDVMFIVDITEENKPFPVSSFQVPEEPGDFCHKGGRFGPHSFQDAYNPNFDKTMVILAYFNAGIRAVDIRDPFHPVEVGYYIPEENENTIEICVEIDGAEECNTSVQTNNVNTDDRGYIYAVDRAGTGLHILELTGPAREIVGLN